MFPHLNHNKWELSIAATQVGGKGATSSEHLAADCKQIARIMHRCEGTDFKSKVTPFNEDYMAVLERTATPWTQNSLTQYG